MVPLNQIQSKVRQKELVSLTQALIQAKTVNPPGDEYLAVDVLERRLKELGIPYKIFEKQEGRPNLVAWLKGDRGPRLLLQGHTDVVPPEGKWKVDPFSGQSSGGRIWGRGAADMKGGLASIFHSLEVLYQLDFRPRGDLYVSACCNEETGDNEKIGMHHVLDRIRPDEVVIAEPTRLCILAAEKGPYWLQVQTTGKAAHGSHPELGRNAIEEMAEVILKLKKLKLKYQDHPLLTGPTISVGTISGGSKTNIVPASCTMTLDIRTVPGQRKKYVQTQIKKVLGSAKITRELNYSPPLEVDLDKPFVKNLRSSIEEVLGKPCRFMGASGSTDAKISILEYGIPTVVCGPGKEELCHVENENIGISELMDAARVFSLFAVKRLSAPAPGSL